ncbi:hypothetical protein CDAR_467141 [Caerostris darwini]|uniref:Uncharacterized protein n=1 Tax=Caerostris darwini TaxID=1538125 RepID=A0AAV4RKV9_9ARAC|nr:hypothetical protein CDAR_467141 [Caerostris darwini]
MIITQCRFYSITCKLVTITANYCKPGIIPLLNCKRVQSERVSSKERSATANDRVECSSVCCRNNRGVIEMLSDESFCSWNNTSSVSDCTKYWGGEKRCLKF